MKLVASMIVRNELDRYLPLAVDHLLTYCDEIAVLDDGSDDGTFDYLESHERVRVQTSRISAFYENESAARNELLRWTYQAEPDYVLSIDADEFVEKPDVIRSLVDKARNPVYVLDMQEVWRADDHLHIRHDGHWGKRWCPILWQAPLTWTKEWDIPDRKLACGREPQKVRRTKFQRSGSAVFHFGWTCASEREARFARYAEHDQGKFHRDAHLQSILWGDDRVQTRPVSWPPGLDSVRDAITERSGR